MIAKGLYGLIPFLVSIALTFGFALTFKELRKRAQRRSPLHGKKAGHLPGQQLVERVGHHHDEVMMSILLMYMALPLMFTGWAGFYVPWDTMKWSWRESIFLAGAVLLFGCGVYWYIKHFNARSRAIDGLAAERITGMQLNRLVAQGCIVLHDIPADGFNIDHVVIGPCAVYAVETKSFRRPKHERAGMAHRVTYDGKRLFFADFNSPSPIEQAARQAQWLRRELHNVLGQDYPVVAAVALPGWFIDRTDEGKRSETVVFTPMGKGADFMARGAERILETQRRVVAQALATRYPSLEL